MDRKINVITYTPSEERWNTWSHAVGIVLAIAVGILFLRLAIARDDGWSLFSISLYLFGMLSSYVASTFYHATAPQTTRKEILRRLDHAAIYWHIAGSYSPIMLIPMRHEGLWGWALFIFIWTTAIAGSITSFRHLKSHSHLETLCYCLMGLSVLVALKPLMESISASAFAWIIAEGVCYITGALFYSVHRRRYMHTVFHFFVLAGTICHMMAVWHILITK